MALNDKNREVECDNKVSAKEEKKGHRAKTYLDI